MTRWSGIKKAIAFYSIVAFLLIAITTSPCFSSCDFDWQPGQGLPSGAEYIYAATVWDPDGKGPLKPLLVLGGSFSGESKSVVAWDGESFQPLGSGVDGFYNNVFALTVYKGQLIAAGDFTKAGGIDANRIASWDGTSWHPLGTGMDQVVTALTIYNGDLIAGGMFIGAGGQTVNCIARWDGNSWHPLGGGPGGDPYALTVYNGKLIAGGSIFYWGSKFISQWNGNNWQGMGTGVSGQVNALIVYNGQLIAGNDNHIASWDGNGWHDVGTGMNYYGIVRSLTIYNGYLVAGGQFTSAGGINANCIAAWDGSNWHSLGSGMSGGGQNGPCVYALTSYNGQLIAGGDFTTAGGKDSFFWASWGLPVNYAGDLNHDCGVDESDLQLFSQKWLNIDCLYNGWCDEADLNYDTKVDLLDYAVFANHWLYQTIFGDFDASGYENFADFAILAKSWMSQSGESNYNSACDISSPSDNVIDWKDMAAFAEDWLKLQYPPSDSMKWSEANWNMANISTSLRAYYAEHNCNAPSPTSLAQLDITPADLDWQYFNYECYSIISSACDSGHVSFVLKCDASYSTKPDKPIYPTAMVFECLPPNYEYVFRAASNP